MTKPFHALALVGAFTVGATADGAVGLVTEYTLLVGSPAHEAGSGTVLIVPGTIVPEPEAERYAASVFDVRDKLKETYRLGTLDVAAQSFEMIEVGKPCQMRVPKGDLGIIVTLVGYDDDTASYQVRFDEKGKILAEPTVAVKRGGRVIVATRDGAAAPYAFVLLSPRSPRTGSEKERGGTSPGAITEPEVVHKVTPVYPETSRKALVQGVVVLEMTIDEQGRVADLRVVRSADPDLDKAAADAVRQWRFDPARDAAGKTVAVLNVVTIRFSLE